MPDQTNARIERLDWLAAESQREAWLDLIGDSLEANPFLEPGFVLPLAQHTAPAQRPSFLFVWAPDAPRLLALFALDAAGGALWRHPLSPISTPLIRRGFAGVAFDGLIEALRPPQAGAGALLCPGLDAQGPTFAALVDHAAQRAIAARPVDVGARAALRGSPGLSRKRGKELARLARRLREKGSVSLSVSATPAQVREAAEEFLALEASGWKGARGTALVCDPAQATFARVALRGLAREGKCRIYALVLDGAAIASGVIFLSRDQAAFWKIAYDGRYAACSPGAQLTVGIGEALVAEGVALVDSCAMPNHPMIDHLWTDRRAIADVFVGVAGDAFEQSVQRETNRRELRRMAKRAYLALSGRRAV